MSIALNDAQLEILKLFRHDQSAEDLEELKSLLMTYLTGKISREADKAFDERGYSASIFEEWKSERFCKSSHP